MNSKLEEFRGKLPEVVGTITQIIADNPVQFGICIAGGIVAAAAARNIVRPKTMVELLALEVVMQAAIPYAASYLVDSGIVPFRVRDQDGKLVPFEPKKLKAVR
jgi:hypothetical protein